MALTRAAARATAAFSHPIPATRSYSSITRRCTPSLRIQYHTRVPMTATSSTPTTLRTPTEKPFRLLYDSGCPLCLKEVSFLRRRSADTNGNICFVDIADNSYNPSIHGDISYEDGMKSIHGITPDGSILTGVTVFREVYNRIGLGWVYAITQVPGVGWLADRIYDVWAGRRLQLTGRGGLEQVLQQRKSCVDKGPKVSKQGENR